MSWLSGSKRGLGQGTIYLAGSVLDTDLMSVIRHYRRTVASRYRSLSSDEFSELPPGLMHCSPKVDGELWFLVKVDKEAALVSTNGRVIIGDVPLLTEAQQTFATKAKAGTILAGELFALSGQGRPRVGGVAQALAVDSDGARLGFQAFDLVASDGRAEPPEQYADRLAEVRRLLDGGKRVVGIKTDVVTTVDQVKELYEKYVESDKAEGLVVRSADRRIFKVKPTISLDCVVVGFTQRQDDPEQARSLLLGLTRADGSVQLVGACGNLGTEDDRRAMKASLEPLVVASRFRRGSSAGAVYRLTKPELVVEIECTDLQALTVDGDPIKNWALSLDKQDGWVPLCPVASVSMIHPRWLRSRSDKMANEIDTRLSQVSERCLVFGQEDKAQAHDLPASTIERREVYTKETKGQLSVRKLLVWKTNKDEVASSFSAFVVHFTDFSPGRAQQIKRTVRLAPSRKEADLIADGMIASQIKKGWNKV